MNNKENTNKVINGGVSAEMIQGWKNQYGRVSEVVVPDNETNEDHVGYFRRPDMKTMHAVSAVSKTNEVKASEVIFDNCWLGGSEALKTDALYKMAAMQALGALFGRYLGTLKNL